MIESDNPIVTAWRTAENRENPLGEWGIDALIESSGDPERAEYFRTHRPPYGYRAPSLAELVAASFGPSDDDETADA
jgi:hypothetical protein